jgi:predicted amidophosphoribosyltransferase
MIAAMHPGYCPQCGERVTPYAAGCALCGADLDPRRWQTPPAIPQRFAARLAAALRRRASRASRRRNRPLSR